MQTYLLGMEMVDLAPVGVPQNIDEHSQYTFSNDHKAPTERYTLPGGGFEEFSPDSVAPRGGADSVQYDYKTQNGNKVSVKYDDERNMAFVTVKDTNGKQVVGSATYEYIESPPVTTELQAVGSIPLQDEPGWARIAHTGDVSIFGTPAPSLTSGGSQAALATVVDGSRVSFSAGEDGRLTVQVDETVDGFQKSVQLYGYDGYDAGGNPVAAAPGIRFDDKNGLNVDATGASQSQIALQSFMSAPEQRRANSLLTVDRAYMQNANQLAVDLAKALEDPASTKTEVAQLLSQRNLMAAGGDLRKGTANVEQAFRMNEVGSSFATSDGDLAWRLEQKFGTEVSSLLKHDQI